MAHKQKEPRIKKSVRFDTDTLILIEEKAKKTSKPFSEVVRRAVNKSIPGRKRLKKNERRK